MATVTISEAADLATATADVTTDQSGDATLKVELTGFPISTPVVVTVTVDSAPAPAPAA